MNTTQTKATIYILDDNPDIRTMIQSILQFSGYSVFPLSSKEALHQQIQLQNPDLLIMDMLLSGADGRDICKALKNDTSTSSIPVIMISAHPDAQQSCYAAGANIFIEKPFELKTFLEAVKELLKSS